MSPHFHTFASFCPCSKTFDRSRLRFRSPLRLCSHAEGGDRSWGSNISSKVDMMRKSRARISSNRQNPPPKQGRRKQERRIVTRQRRIVCLAQGSENFGVHQKDSVNFRVFECQFEVSQTATLWSLRSSWDSIFQRLLRTAIPHFGLKILVNAES